MSTKKIMLSIENLGHYDLEMVASCVNKQLFLFLQARKEDGEDFFDDAVKMRQNGDILGARHNFNLALAAGYFEAYDELYTLDREEDICEPIPKPVCTLVSSVGGSWIGTWIQKLSKIDAQIKNAASVIDDSTGYAQIKIKKV